MSGADEFSPEELEAGRKLFAQAATFMLGVVKLDGLPDEGPPEVAFAGRSNVGKSSLLNALTNHKGLARASNTPGRTREINYFDLGGVMRLVDLPGYGYARVSRKDVEAWTRLTLAFLQGRSVLRRVCVLIDSRHGLKNTDLEVMDILDEAGRELPDRLYQDGQDQTDSAVVPGSRDVGNDQAASGGAPGDPLDLIGNWRRD